MSVDERQVRQAWDRSAPVRSDRVRFSKDPDAEQFPQFEVPRFPRQLETYVNGLVEVGFRITRLQEPRPTAEMAEAHPWLARWRDHAAIFLYLAADKPKISVDAERPAKETSG